MKTKYNLNDEVYYLDLETYEEKPEPIIYFGEIIKIEQVSKNTIIYTIKDDYIDEYMVLGKKIEECKKNIQKILDNVKSEAEKNLIKKQKSINDC